MPDSSDDLYTSAESDLEFLSANVSSHPSSDSPSTAGFVTVASSSKVTAMNAANVSKVKENEYIYDLTGASFACCGKEIELYGNGTDVYFKDFVKQYNNQKPRGGYGFFDSILVDNLAHQNIHSMRPSQIATLQATFFDNPAVEQPDFIGISSTGSGKTHAFLVPIVQECLNRINNATPSDVKRPPLALIFAHTNTLVESIYEKTLELVKGTGINVQIIAGKYPYIRDTYFDIGICSVGRFSNHFGPATNKIPIDVEHLKYLVMDEADKMAAETLEFHSLYDEMKEKANFATMLFSATINFSIMDYIDIKNFYEFNFGTPNTVALSIKLLFCPVNSRHVIKVTGVATGNIKTGAWKNGERPHPFDALYHTINRINGQENNKRFMVFVKRTCIANFIAQKLTAHGIKAITIYGSSSKSLDNQVIEDRKRLLRQFIEGRVQVLVATQFLTRGTDIQVDYVINYDLPVNYSGFIHRCGRTGRNQKTGTAITFVDFNNSDDYSPKVLQQIVLNTDQSLPDWLTPFANNVRASYAHQMES